MTTSIATRKGTHAPGLPQTGDKRWAGSLDQEDPEIDDGVRLPRQQSAVAEVVSQPGQKSILEMIVRTIEAFHEWLAGPPMTMRDRIRRDIAEHAKWRPYGPMAGA